MYYRESKMGRFWIVHKGFRNIYQCYQIDKHLYEVDFVCDLHFNFKTDEYKGYFVIDLIGSGNDNGLSIMYSTSAIKFDSRKDLDNYLLLEKL
jgi:hypothetical protein